jgi:hypothetical protein
VPSISLTPDFVLCQAKTSFNRKTLLSSSSQDMRKAKDLGAHDFRTGEEAISTSIHEQFRRFCTRWDHEQEMAATHPGLSPHVPV